MPNYRSSGTLGFETHSRDLYRIRVHLRVYVVISNQMTVVYFSSRAMTLRRLKVKVTPKTTWSEKTYWYFVSILMFNLGNFMGKKGRVPWKT